MAGSSGLRGDRERLVNTDFKVSQDYDKAILTIGAGALGVSVAFLKDIANDPPIALSVLKVSWGCLAASILLVMVSNYSSHWALLEAIFDLDKGKGGNVQGGCFTWITEFLNILALLTLVAGVIGVLVFAYSNLAA